MTEVVLSPDDLSLVKRIAMAPTAITWRDSAEVCEVQPMWKRCEAEFLAAEKDYLSIVGSPWLERLIRESEAE